MHGNCHCAKNMSNLSSVKSTDDHFNSSGGWREGTNDAELSEQFSQGVVCSPPH